MKEQGRKGAHSRPKVIFICLALVFILPLALAWMMYAHRITFGSHDLNHGYLIPSPFSVSTLSIQDTKGRRFKNQQHKWWMMLWVPQPCAKACENGLYTMRQVRQATGKNRNRIERAVLTDQQGLSDRVLTQLIGSEYIGTQPLLVNQHSWSNAMGQHVQVPFALKQGAVYVVDPNGNVMMVYPPNSDPTAMFEDIQRLLKVSQIG